MIFRSRADGLTTAGASNVQMWQVVKLKCTGRFSAYYMYTLRVSSKSYVKLTIIHLIL